MASSCWNLNGSETESIEADVNPSADAAILFEPEGASESLTMPFASAAAVHSLRPVIETVAPAIGRQS